MADQTDPQPGGTAERPKGRVAMGKPLEGPLSEAPATHGTGLRLILRSIFMSVKPFVPRNARITRV